MSLVEEIAPGTILRSISGGSSLPPQLPSSYHHSGGDWHDDRDRDRHYDDYRSFPPPQQQYPPAYPTHEGSGYYPPQHQQQRGYDSPPRYDERERDRSGGPWRGDSGHRGYPPPQDQRRY
jgi:hypothetical protein